MRVNRLRMALAVAAILLLAFGGAAYWLLGNIDALAKRAIERYGSQMTAAKVSVDAVQLRGADGIGVVRGLVVGNPAGFRSEHALKVGVIEVQLDVRTLADPVVVIKRIVIDSPDLIYEKGDPHTNFEAIQRNIARSLDDGAAANSSSTRPSPASPGRKLIVDELVIRHAHARAVAPALLGQGVSATLPDVVLRRLGRAEGGLTPAQLGQVVARAISQRLVASLGFDRAVKSLGDRVKGLFGR
ncbi:MAG TPA: hypothetical protein VJ743_03880 [Albitalea sp.]|nr:hypothetical protein [Albitalea sp.]